MPYNINRFHLIALITWQFCSLYATQQIFGIFANYVPKWRCIANETFTSDCNVFIMCKESIEFEETAFRSTSIDFNWICGPRAYVAALYNQVNFFGVLVGTLLFGALSDAIGRRPMAILSLSSAMLSTFFSGLAPNWQLLLLLRFFVGFICGGVIVGIYTYIMELILPEQRMVLRGFSNWVCVKDVLKVLVASEIFHKYVL
ncbi:unnamed protein product [Toxocara canis]|uniref:MFS domain-containing protein n=1 Tax=Toxocara canis TaxID=6265 RepID=A0A183U417_TOXCA|nr:unnamed protein product [Toxocara canis]